MVPALSGSDLAGNQVTIRYSNWAVPTVIYNLAPGVPGNDENFTEAVVKARSRFHFVVVSPMARLNDALSAHIANVKPQWQGVPVDVVKDVPEDLAQAMWLTGFPRTYIISTDGKMLHNFSGPWGEKLIAAEIEHLFGIVLPNKKRP